jgi:phage terminase Nu1 subunit (DNA packaging protein)
MGKTVNQTELALLHDVSDVTIWEWQKAGMPVLERGERGAANRYDVGATIRWRVAREADKSASKTVKDRRDLVALEREEIELAKQKDLLVPVEQIEPVWKTRVLSAAALMLGRHSRLAGLLEATPGVEAKRQLLKLEDAAFLTKLGVNGERIQAEIEELLAKVSHGEADAFMKRIAAYDNQPDSAGPADPGVDDVRPPEEDPPLGMG